MSTLDTVFLVAIIGGYFVFVLLLTLFDERRLERRR
jgi:hypothetical protein